MMFAGIALVSLLTASIAALLSRLHQPHPRRQQSPATRVTQ